ncbi:MAG: hypothetical protein NC930_02160 [Candidatus Omnitrophica bacterium]|nr:hypothetical protein [Candidatus Omnitrophota bacterium]
MKTIFIISLSILLGVGGVAAADQGESGFETPKEGSEAYDASSFQPDAIEEPEAMPKVNAKGNLADLKAAKASSRIQDLERRVKSLELDYRFLDGRVREIDRTVSDLRRRRD